MSWDLIALNYEGHPPDIGEKMPEPKPLGSRDGVRDSIGAYLPDVRWSRSNPRQGVYRGNGFSIEFDVGESDPVTHVMLTVHGAAEAISALVAFAQPNRWSLLDCSTTQFLAPEHALRYRLSRPRVVTWAGYEPTSSGNDFGR